MSHLLTTDLISSPEGQQQFSSAFISAYLAPAFGAMSKRETDVLVFSLLHQIAGFEKKTVYDIARILRVTPARVRSMKMQMELRDPSRTEESLRQEIVDLLSAARYLKDGGTIQFGVDDPLLREDIADRLKKLKSVADSSFNKELVRVPIDAFVIFISEIMSADQKKKVKQALVKAGLPDSSIKGVLAGAFKKLGEKVAGEAGDATAKTIADAAGPAIRSLFDSATEVITETWTDLIGQSSQKSDQS